MRAIISLVEVQKARRNNAFACDTSVKASGCRGGNQVLRDWSQFLTWRLRRYAVEKPEEVTESFLYGAGPNFVKGLKQRHTLGSSLI